MERKCCRAADQDPEIPAETLTGREAAAIFRVVNGVVKRPGSALLLRSLPG